MAIGAGCVRDVRKRVSGVRDPVRRVVSGAVEVPAARVYLAVVAVLVPWASPDAFGVFGESG
ncbi:hypothetical protein GCM10027160_04990 [Streptomyces calidiresistens]